MVTRFCLAWIGSSRRSWGVNCQIGKRFCPFVFPSWCRASLAAPLIPVLLAAAPPRSRAPPPRRRQVRRWRRRSPPGTRARTCPSSARRSSTRCTSRRPCSRASTIRLQARRAVSRHCTPTTIRPLPHSYDCYYPYHTHTTLLPHSHHPFQTPCRPSTPAHAQSCDALLTLTLTICPQAMRCLR